MPVDPKPLIRDRALALGFDAVGFAAAELGPEARVRLGAFLAAGQHGDMGWMADRAEQRAHPRALWAEARSVIALGMSYAPAEDPLANLAAPAVGNISVYARNRDYHDVVKGRLKTLAQFVVSRFGPEVKVFVDTAPVMEKPLAARAGLGWQGKHTNLVSRAHGSWLFLGEIYTTLELAPSVPLDRTVVSESGIGRHEDVRHLADAGARCFLVGESLLRQADVGQAARALLGRP